MVLIRVTRPGLSEQAVSESACKLAINALKRMMTIRTSLLTPLREKPGQRCESRKILMTKMRGKPSTRKLTKLRRRKEMLLSG